MGVGVGTGLQPANRLSSRILQRRVWRRCSVWPPVSQSADSSQL